MFARTDTGALQFHRLEPPDDADVERLLLRIADRIEALIDIAEPTDVDDDDVLAADQAQAQAPALRPHGLGGLELPHKPRCAFVDGYSHHADLAVHARDRNTLERLLRYGMRPPFSQRRPGSLTPTGDVRLRLRKPYHTGPD